MAMKRFHGFCMKYNVFNPFLASEYLLCCFAASLLTRVLHHRPENHISQLSGTCRFPWASLIQRNSHPYPSLRGYKLALVIQGCLRVHPMNQAPNHIPDPVPDSPLPLLISQSGEDSLVGVKNN